MDFTGLFKLDLSQNMLDQGRDAMRGLLLVSFASYLYNELSSKNICWV